MNNRYNELDNNLQTSIDVLIDCLASCQNETQNEEIFNEYCTYHLLQRRTDRWVQ